jgi:hypothetical protein
MLVMLLLATGTLVAGVMGVLYGLAHIELYFGNTMLLAGVIGVNTSFIILGLCTATRELSRVWSVQGPSSFEYSSSLVDTREQTGLDDPIAQHRADRADPVQHTHSPAAEHRPRTAPNVTVLDSGVIEGMAYSLFSDGSIGMQTPTGTIRFASIDNLRNHLASFG